MKEVKVMDEFYFSTDVIRDCYYIFFILTQFHTLGRVLIIKGGLDSTSRPRVEPTLNRVHITSDNPRSNPFYIEHVECRVKPVYPYPDVTLLTT